MTGQEWDRKWFHNLRQPANHVAESILDAWPDASADLERRGVGVWRGDPDYSVWDNRTRTWTRK